MTASTPSILLYDTQSTHPSTPWNPNTWKARLALNYKRIPYKTVWLSYPDIEPTLKKLGAPARTTDPHGKPHYMLPIIVDIGSKPAVVVGDSLKITQYLDAKFPERPVIPSNSAALQAAFEATFNRTVGPTLGRIIIPLAWQMLDERSQAFFYEARERWCGDEKKMTMKRWRPEAYITDKEWNALKDAFDDIAASVDRLGHDPIYIAGGDEPTRADMIVLSCLALFKACAPEKWEQEVVHWGGGRWARLWRVSEPWRCIR
ncbi:hypothetical protein BU17DRAFT_71959 [Hysterangium stoloniferum]|nr:hypothetical protein BU17DRAFT_71959 [Hysterangium stoloniferum]